MRTVAGGTESEGRREAPLARRELPLPFMESGILDHLEDLRWRIFKVAAALMVGFGVGFAVVHYLHVTALLIKPIHPYLPDGRLNAFSPTQPFFLEIKLAFIVGAVLVSPVLLYQVWAFLSPNLGAEHRKLVIPTLYMGVVLFAAGVAMAYFVVLPLGLRFLFSFQRDYLQPTIGAHEYLGFVVRLMGGFGVVFELPVVMMILSSLGLVTPRFLREKRRYSIVIICVCSAIMTPPDVFSQVMMMIPLLGLYELSIVLSALVWKRRDRRIQAQGPAEEAQESG